MQANGKQPEYRGVLPARQAPTTFTTKLARFARRAGSYDDRSNQRKLIYKPVWVAPWTVGARLAGDWNVSDKRTRA